MKEEKNIKCVSMPWKDGFLRYEINESQRKVACIYRPNKSSFDLDFCISKNTGISYEDLDVIVPMFKMPVCVGVAICSPDDSFDEEKGMVVAFMKMFRKYHSFRMNIIHLSLKRVDRIKNQLVSLKNEES